MTSDLYKTYPVHRLAEPLTLDANWEKPAWRRAATADIALHMGERPDHIPETRVRMLYDDQSLYLIFEVRDRYVRAVGVRDGDRVWEDSCVEFFFTPGDDLAAGYFNFETNCGGARYWHHHPAAGGDRPLAADDLARVAVAHTLNGAIEPEIAGPVTWRVEYRVPIEILRNYTTVAQPAPGVRWRANFQKCADHSSHPHFLTWSRIDWPQPKFHLPEFFGWLEFKD